MALERADVKRKQEEYMRKNVEQLESEVILDSVQKEWLIKQIPFKILTLQLLYKGTRDGF